jgi:3',5'-cyclic AMP phosphodiesterase CpdA
VISTVITAGCKKSRPEETFSIAYMTDIHVQPELNADDGFKQALDSVVNLNPDFVITGGDLIMDALGQRYGKADSLYNLYSSIVGNYDLTFYNTMGNHEIYGIYRSRSGASTDHPEYGEKMFENRLGRSYQVVEHKGWKFFILNSIEDTGKESYEGVIDSVQIKWLRGELEKTDKKMPLVITTHIPFITVSTQRYEGSTSPNDSSIVVYNSKEVLDMFKGYSLKLVLQGHLHIVEDISIDGVHYITGGAVSGAWWKGPNVGFEEGFLLLNFGKSDFTWRYVDFKWQPVTVSQ